MEAKNITRQYLCDITCMRVLGTVLLQLLFDSVLPCDCGYMHLVSDSGKLMQHKVYKLMANELTDRYLLYSLMSEFPLFIRN